jgi:2,3-bisphosphoglycerate-dependent phosphoglycerate mutase
LLRHGQSVWNGAEARFTGWADVSLTVKGRVEAVAAGQLLRSRGFSAKKIDVAFTSMLQRAYETCELSLASMAGPQQHTWSSARIRRCAGLNERHYGALQGELKDNPALVEKYGEDVMKDWRRTMDHAPPPLNAQHPHYLPPPAPTTESLEDCQRRALACFRDKIAPVLFGDEALPPLPRSSEQGSGLVTSMNKPDERVVMLVAHSNTIRALMAHFDNVPSDAVPKLHVPNSVPILYRFDSSTRLPISSQLQSAAGGSHARWVLSPDNHAQVKKALEPGGMLTRALFDACTSASMAEGGQNHVLTMAELEAGLTALIKASDADAHGGVDNAVISVAKKVIRELYGCPVRGSTAASDVITLAEFERRASTLTAELPEWWADPAQGRRRWALEQGYPEPAAARAVQSRSLARSREL